MDRELAGLDGGSEAALVREMLTPTRRTCQAHPGDYGGGGHGGAAAGGISVAAAPVTASSSRAAAARWVFLVQTGGSRRQLVSAQVSAFLKPYRRVVVAEHAAPFRLPGNDSAAPLPPSSASAPPPPPRSLGLITQTWGGSVGQKVLAGLWCVDLHFKGTYDFVAVLDDDTAVRPKVRRRPMELLPWYVQQARLTASKLGTERVGREA
jgi:hypothetical protein